MRVTEGVLEQTQALVSGRSRGGGESPAWRGTITEGVESSGYPELCGIWGGVSGLSSAFQLKSLDDATSVSRRQRAPQ